MNTDLQTVAEVGDRSVFLTSRARLRFIASAQQGTDMLPEPAQWRKIRRERLLSVFSAFFCGKKLTVQGRNQRKSTAENAKSAEMERVLLVFSAFFCGKNLTISASVCIYGFIVSTTLALKATDSVAHAAGVVRARLSAEGR